MNYDTIMVDCGRYGKRKLVYNISNCLPIIEILKTDWPSYWKRLCPAYEKILRKNNVEEWGNLEWMKNKIWEIRIFDSFSESNPMPEGRIIFSLCFIINGECNVPIWDVFMDDLAVTHCQPVF